MAFNCNYSFRLSVYRRLIYWNILIFFSFFVAYPWFYLFHDQRKMPIEVKSFLSLRFFLKRLKFPLNFFAKTDNLVFRLLFKSSVENPPLPKPKIIDHITQNNNFIVVICWRLELLKIKLRPLNHIVNDFPWIHLEIGLRSSIDNSLL